MPVFDIKAENKIEHIWSYLVTTLHKDKPKEQLGSLYRADLSCGLKSEILLFLTAVSPRSDYEGVKAAHSERKSQ
ncbi:hypothetical protein PBY51_002966 [Eleginops maclovinus]|uniref:Uncharacterized protein n=1 Tax=Eleginops maclovinus TaxID=56733 RepID=A0AAN8AGB9_ELEMC|nr:hypothetical protein PBY51_002966 [Eleginops maclovinus]